MRWVFFLHPAGFESVTSRTQCTQIAHLNKRTSCLYRCNFVCFLSVDAVSSLTLETELDKVARLLASRSVPRCFPEPRRFPFTFSDFSKKTIIGGHGYANLYNTSKNYHRLIKLILTLHLLLKVFSQHVPRTGRSSQTKTNSSVTSLLWLPKPRTVGPTTQT